MTIASAFNDIAVAQGGTAAKSGAITAAIDALNDALAGSDQPQAKTIEEAVRLLGEHIGGGGGGAWGAPVDITVTNEGGFVAILVAQNPIVDEPDTYFTFYVEYAEAVHIPSGLYVVLANENALSLTADGAAFTDYEMLPVGYGFQMPACELFTITISE